MNESIGTNPKSNSFYEHIFVIISILEVKSDSPLLCHEETRSSIEVQSMGTVSVTPTLAVCGSHVSPFSSISHYQSAVYPAQTAASESPADRSPLEVEIGVQTFWTS